MKRHLEFVRDLPKGFQW